MILVDNRNVLRLKNRDLLNRMTEVEKNAETGNIIVEQAKTGVLTLKMLFEGKMQYIHSKYDPEKDAQRFVDKFENENFKHVLFVGTGLGYHIKNFTNSHPDTKYSIYEPDEQVLLTYLANKKLDELPLNNLIRIFTGTNEEILMEELKDLLKTSNGLLKIITLPIYEKNYCEQIELIMKELVDSMKVKKSALITNVSFQKRWTINSIKNFPKVLDTPNILHDIDKDAFKGKPAIIVAAGPSLNEEFENLRYIKENGLAYIFSVGSAINALIEHGIYPDAACTYDPKERNQNVIKVIKERDITEIPLIFGSSVGYETLDNYPGPMLHMIMSQDTVAPNLINNYQTINIVQDASTIAVVTFQMLCLMGVSQILLVGQNLGFLNNLRFADGIKYNHISSEIKDEEKEKLIKIKDVFGNEIYSSEMYIQMKHQLEIFTKKFKNTVIINTTKGGAHIEGTIFMPLSEVIVERLDGKTEVVLDWWNAKNKYDLNHTKLRRKQIEGAKHRCRELIESTNKELKELDDLVHRYQLKQLEKKFAKLDKEFNKLRKNQYYTTFIEPMIRVQYQSLVEKNQYIKFENNLLKKGKLVVEIYSSYLFDCQMDFQFIEPFANEIINA